MGGKPENDSLESLKKVCQNYQEDLESVRNESLAVGINYREWADEFAETIEKFLESYTSERRL
ncbi:MAG: hypothetical protein GY928_25895 [Colwellia sp.]|nr:hypothetical protein [Colwellia sp.]